MATGKTTLGHALRKAAGVDFVDLDSLVEDSAGMSVPQIFATAGQQHFRTLEARALARVCADGAPAGRTLVVACGGGTPCFGNNMDTMLATGTVVWLRARTDIVIARLLDAPGQRPIVEGLTRPELETFLERNLAERTPHYSRAHATFDSSELDTPDQIRATAARFITQFIRP